MAAAVSTAGEDMGGVAGTAVPPTEGGAGAASGTVAGLAAAYIVGTGSALSTQNAARIAANRESRTQKTAAVIKYPVP